jgi:hypothetical protein
LSNDRLMQILLTLAIPLFAAGVDRVVMGERGEAFNDQLLRRRLVWTNFRVLFWSRATRDLLKSFGWGIRRSISLWAATMVPFRRRLPHSISPLEESGFEPSVPLLRYS